MTRSPVTALAPATILVVDDHEAMADLLCATLHLDAHETVIAFDGASALARLVAGGIDLVLLDAGLPDLDGLEVCRRIKEALPLGFLPVILITGRTRRDDKLAGLASGADDYITKPFDAEELLARVRVLLRTKRVEDALLRRNRELASLNAVATLVNQSPYAGEIMPRALDEVLTLLDLSHGGILRWDRSSDSAVLIAYQARDERDRPAARPAPGSRYAVPPRFVHGQQSEGLVIAGREAVQWFEPLQAAGLRRHFLVPLRSKDILRGFLAVAGGQDAPDLDEQVTVQVLQALGYQLGMALEYSLLFAQEQRQRERSDAVAALGRAIGTSVDVAHILHLIAATTRDCFGGQDILIALRGSEGREDMIWSSRPLTTDQHDRVTALLRRTDLTVGESPALFTRYLEEQDMASVGGHLAAVFGAAFLLCPLLVAGRALGLLAVLETGPDHPDSLPNDLTLIEHIAQQTVIAIENARLIGDQRHMVQRLTELDASKSQFISIASHEFRTPLSIIKGFANLLKRSEEFGFDRATERGYLDVIDTQIQALTQLIDNMLSVSRIESGRIPVHPQRLDLTAAIRRAGSLMALQAAQRSIEINLDDMADLWVHADAQHVEQVLLNLLSNALKYSDDGTMVHVRTRSQDGMAMVEVTDQGVGIAPDHLPQLFEKFNRLENRRAVEAGGTGLGLYIAKNCVDVNGGRLWAESVPGVGSTFTFTLPLRSPDSNGAEDGEPSIVMPRRS